MNRVSLTFCGFLLSVCTASAASEKCDPPTAKAAAEWEINFKSHLSFIGSDIQVIKDSNSEKIKGYQFEFVRVLIDEERALASAVNGKIYVPINPDGSCGEASAVGKSMNPLPRR